MGKVLDFVEQNLDEKNLVDLNCFGEKIMDCNIFMKKKCGS